MGAVQGRNGNQIKYPPGKIVNNDNPEKKEHRFGKDDEADCQSEEYGHQKIRYRTGQRNL